MFPRPAPGRRLATGAVLLSLLGTLTTSAWAGPRDHRPTPHERQHQHGPSVTHVPSTAGSATPLSGYSIRSTAEVTDSAAAVSSPGYRAAGWYPAGPRSTVLAALLADGVYPDPFHSTDQQKIPREDFQVPWWYRSDFTVEDTGQRTRLDFSGVVSAADVYVNGHQVAGAADVTGAYTRHELDITSLVRSGTNTVAFRVRPNDPNKHLTTGWLDWLQPPPDRNMGLVRDVLVRRDGPVALRDAHVVSELAVPALDTADLTVEAQARNDSDAPVTAQVTGSVAGTRLTRTVPLAAHESRTVTFSPADVPGLHLTSPKVWWPAGMGGQPLYDLDLAVSVAGAVSDTAHERFGIRDVRAPLNTDGARQYRINGRKLLIKGGGWSPDEFLRWDAGYVEDRLKYALDLGLNTIRLEGHIEPDEFFDLADRLGVLTLPGWECCDKWEGQVNGGSESGEKWTEADYPVAKASMAAEAARLRRHPSVISFLIGSDAAPDARIEKDYLDALRAADWPTPVVPAASDNASPQLGRSGMKMTGPYEWVPPDYWYAKREGGATGFNSETSAGPDVPTLDTLRRMMTPAELDTLWKDPGARQYHRSPSTVFGTLKIYDAALTGRYGAPAGLTDYVRKAQLAQYENVRAQYEAYGRNATDSSKPATGVVYWMFNSGWTSLHWQLVDRYLDQGGAYFGAKKANEPLHIQYSYDDRSVVVVNNRHGSTGPLTARATLFDPDGTQRYDRTVTGLTVDGDGAHGTALTLPSLSGLPPTYLLRLTLTDADGKEVSRNVYWLSTRADKLDWAHTDWYYTPVTGYADLRGLSSMAQVPVSASASTVTSGGTSTTTVTVRNTGDGRTPSLLTDVHLVDAHGKPVLPVRWSDNEVSLWPGESATLTATYRTADLRGSAPRVRVSGWNTPERTVPAA